MHLEGTRRRGTSRPAPSSAGEWAAAEVGFSGQVESRDGRRLITGASSRVIRDLAKMTILPADSPFSAPASVPEPHGQLLRQPYLIRCPTCSFGFFKCDQDRHRNYAAIAAVASAGARLHLVTPCLEAADLVEVVPGALDEVGFGDVTRDRLATNYSRQ